MVPKLSMEITQMLKAKYSKVEDIPEQYKDLYEERGGEWMLKRIDGLVTTADVDRVKRSLEAEKKEHADTKAKLEKFGNTNPEDVIAAKDEIEELKAKIEAGAAGRFDEDKFQEAVDKRVARETATKDRELETTKQLYSESEAKVVLLETSISDNKIESALRKAATKAKIVATAVDDVVMYGKNIFEITEDGEIITKDNVGVTPAIAPDVFLEDMKEKRPHWWPANVGGGATGGTTMTGSTTSNPFTHNGWNITEQAKLVRENPDKAAQMAKVAGTFVGGKRPVATK